MPTAKQKRKSVEGSRVKLRPKKGRPELTPGEEPIRKTVVLPQALFLKVEEQAEEQGYQVGALIRYFVEYCVAFGLRAPKKKPDYFSKK